MDFSKINYAVIFNRKKKLNQDGKGLIQIRAYQKGKVKYFSTKISIKPEYWDDRNKRVKASHPNSFVVNKQLHQQINEMEAYENLIINRHGFLPLERLQDYKAPDKWHKSFTSFYKDELDLSVIQPDSLKGQRTTFNKLKKFCSIIYFEDLTFDFVTRFNKFLHNQKLGKNTIQKHHKVVGKYIRLAINKGYMKIDDNPYKGYTAKGQEPERDFFNELELERLENLKFPKREQHLERLRDFLLLVCYTGLRYSDANSITPKHLRETSKGLEIAFVARKTQKQGRTPLYLLFKEDGEPLSRPERLIKKLSEQHYEKYKNVANADTKPFFGLTNQYINRKVKFLARRIRTNKKITTHIGRRTFATMLNSKGVSAKAIQSLLQHSTTTMTLIYVGISDKMVDDELNKINW